MAGRLYLGQGIKFPFEIDAFGKISYQSDSELIKQSLAIIFGEPTGTEFFREHYGSRIREAMFEPNDIVLTSLLDYYIMQAVSDWEKRISLYDIQYRKQATNPSLMMCSLHYLIKKSSEIDSFIFPYYKELKN